jgi:hypothetical protein
VREAFMITVVAKNRVDSGVSVGVGVRRGHDSSVIVS